MIVTARRSDMSKRYDVIVAGAGPAGMLAAKACGENGLEVALLEKKTDVTKLTRSCAQTLLSMQEYYMGDLVWYNSRDKRICFPATGFSFKYDGPYRNIYAWFVYSPNGHRVQMGSPDESREIGDRARVAIVSDKEALFQSLLDEVKACSVDVFPGVDVEKVTSTPDGVKAEGSGESFEARYLIAADGVNSRIAQTMGFNEGRYYWCNLNVISFYMSGVDAPDPNVVLSSTGYFKEGTALFFMAPRPYDGEYNVQFLTINPNVNLKQVADYFMNEAFSAPWFRNAKTLRSFSAVCSCYDPIRDPFRGNVLVTADAGSTQEIENSGAMICGWKAGQAVSIALRQENLGLESTGIPQYVKWWQETFIEGYDHEAYMKNWVLGLVLTEPEEMNYVFGLVNEPMPPNFNPYSGPKMMGRRTAQLAPIIQEKRPDIFQKLGKLRMPLKEVYAEVTRISQPVT